MVDSAHSESVLMGMEFRVHQLVEQEMVTMVIKEVKVEPETDMAIKTMEGILTDDHNLIPPKIYRPKKLKRNPFNLYSWHSVNDKIDIFSKL